MTKSMRLFLLTALAASSVASGPLAAQAYPTKPIRMLVGFAPGGGVDTSARAVGIPLGAALGQTVVVDNRPGAAGNIAADMVAKSVPDGYTLLMANSTISNPTLFKKVPFDVRKDLDPVALIAIGPSVLVVNPSVPARNVKDFIAFVKAQPGKVTYGSGGVGNITHLEMELLSSMTGTRLIHVPYKGAAPSIIGLVGGEVQSVFSSIPSALGQIRAGKIHPLAVTILKRSSVLPDVPTLDESGVKGYDAASWYAVLAPAGTPKPVIARLGKEIVGVMAMPEVRNRFANDGFEPAGTGPAEFGKFLRAELAKWEKAIKAAGIKPE